MILFRQTFSRKNVWPLVLPRPRTFLLIRFVKKGKTELLKLFPLYPKGALRDK